MALLMDWDTASHVVSVARAMLNFGIRYYNLTKSYLVLYLWRECEEAARQIRIGMMM